MPLINLIHEQRLLVRQREQKIRILMLATLSIGVFAFLATGFNLFNAARFQVMVGSLEAKKKSLEPLMKKLKSNELDQKTLEPKLTTLTSATKATEQWFHLMNYMTVNIPGSVWLSSLKTNQAPDAEAGITVTFGGYSLNHDEIGEILLRLEACPDLEGVTLKFSQERLVEKNKLLEFEISAILQGSRVVKKIKEKESA